MPSAEDDHPEKYGEPLTYDKNFKGPLSKRSCTDVICLLIFIAFLACWGVVGYYAIKNGDPDRLLVPTDSQGLKCGVDSEVISKPYLVFFNLERCIDPLVPINGCPTPQVCVEKCPDSIFIYDQSTCSASNLESIKSKLICNRNVDIRTIQSCTAITDLINSDYCASWYLPSESFLKRCISGMPSSICPLIRPRYLQRSRRALVPTNYLNETDDEHPRFEDMIIMDQRAAVNEPKASCSDSRKLAEGFIKEKVEGQKIVEDIISSKWHILVALIIAMVCSLILIAMMRWLAAPLLWLSIIGVLVMLGFATFYSVTKFIQLRDNPVEVMGGYNIASLVNEYLAKKETWLVLSIISGVVLLIIFLIVIFLRKRIVIAIALVKEGSKAVSSTLTTIFFPIFPWVFQLLVIAFAVTVGLYLASVGTQVHTVVGLDTNCVCSGPAATYVNGGVCDPRTFSENCHPTSAVLSRFLRQSNDNPCAKAACHFKKIDNPYFIRYFHAWNFVGFFWAVFFVSAFGEMVLAATFATWYWTFHKSDVPYFTLTLGLGRTVRYHLGTLAFGSLIVAICRMIRVGLEYLDHKLKKYDNAFVKAILCCMKCFFWCLEKFLKFINKNAYIMCAIHGKNFCGSAKDAFNLLMRNVLRVFALDKVTDFLFFLSKLLITLGMGASVYFYLESEINTHRLHYNYVPVAIVMIGTYLIATVFFGVYSMAVDTLFLCFLEDCERNDGSAERPYFMSSGLMKILGKKNKVSRDQYK
ncbi:choline transporter-like 2 isoform X2 [Bradysia coprophila]|uniref:choline transporter-like 2 isoform X2 n=1 Tax=Bradysia coprophila TaxID=38358 RepID=UPI00187DC850|nr:choline transporter-like 2 isoform X2 [Bradysia coprophila]XP_037044637.1 choline transporter-like 2 isoform X2 [Bradysia coprophila]XP_037044638.1 choline transporter-like 2 isoform X2 [Bradysia coprophila]XP_037044639.1 choline transporter-like 2 isoform X2 [Bradysia coprophila]